MIRFIATIALIQLTISAAFARQSVTEQSKREQALLARVTVYWAKGGSGSDGYTRQHKCATGLRLQTGHCAVDPKKIAYGSRVIFPDGTTLAAVDTGTAVKNRKAARRSGHTIYEQNAIVIDRFFETKRQALSWAGRNPLFMTVRVVPPNQRAGVQLAAPPLRGKMVATTDTSQPKPSNPPLVVSSPPSTRYPFGKVGHGTN
jgi:3D (Asp-Asp-Asp) domain-containing protein